MNMVNKKRQEGVLVATLGTEPQVITIALDKLLEDKHSIKKVVVVYTGSLKVLEALEILEEEFSRGVYAHIAFHKVPVTSLEGRVVEEFISEEDIKALLRTLYTEIRNNRQNDMIVHFLISGGRKVMSVMGMLVAQLLFGTEDCLWYLITKDWLPGSERRLHLSPDEKAWLVQIPILRWSETKTFMRMVAELHDPQEVEIWYERLSRRSEMKRKGEFLKYWLTPAERKVVELVCRGFDNVSIARTLYKSEQTVANQLQNIYEKLKEWMDYPDIKIDRNVLIAQFAPYFVLEE